MKVFDLSGLMVIGRRDVEAAGKAGAKELLIAYGTRLTPSARNAAQKLGITLRPGDTKTPSPERAVGENLEQATLAYGVPPYGSAKGAPKQLKAGIKRLFNSPEANAIRQEICAVGRKLWLRSYVDGSGGNISCKLGENAAICTPTLMSKFDLTPGDLCLVDLDGNQLAGRLPRTSEILLHLEIFKNVPQAKAVVHCHPPHATAYAITGRVPPLGIIPEFDVFVGSVALAPYETPGTRQFAETVLPFARSHNTLLLANHGIVCWADTPTHAEWYAECLETYCWTLMISSQLGVPYSQIPAAKQQELLAIKKQLGLPDARFDMPDSILRETPEPPGAIALVPPAASRRPKS